MHRDIIQAVGNSGIAFIGSQKTIHVLPSDVLLEIFKVLCYDGHHDLSTIVPYLHCTALPGSSQLDDLIRTTHVCHQWREEIISYSPFWSHIPVAEFSLEQIAVYLERSRNLPLDVDVSCTSTNVERVQSALRALSSVSHRIESLLVRFTSCTTMDVLSPLFATKSDLKNVRSLRILSFPMRCAFETFPKSMRYSWFNLSKLQLCCCIPDISILDVANVTSLHLAWSRHETPPTWSQFVALIKSMPSLTILEIEDYTWSEMPMITERVELKKIERLRLSLDTACCRYFLARFDISTAKEIEITCQDYTIKDSILLPSHVSTNNSFEKSNVIRPTVVVSKGLIVFSMALQRGGKEQEISISLCLSTARPGSLKKGTRRIISRWRSDQFQSVSN